MAGNLYELMVREDYTDGKWVEAFAWPEANEEDMYTFFCVDGSCSPGLGQEAPEPDGVWC